ncbi:hypothetical protein QAD02_023786 [Eretmocerus hayati]|uniref:Uncharacterized protein n=1 Tax=Eretmocerus hayati TaxID=131215 RepID=A0ACC2PYH2_9HYME|nr:hypothetical protein QAD02_023786 [Eretmocerus hayati]
MSDNFSPIKRPKPDDGEEDLLRMQQEFNEKKLRPCAKVINLRSANSIQGDQPAKKQSKFAQSRNLEAQKTRVSTSTGCGSLTNVLADAIDNSGQYEKDKLDPIYDYGKLSSKAVLGNIVERRVNVENFEPITDDIPSQFPQSGFPTVFKSSELLQDTSIGGSLFMKSISRKHSNLSTSSKSEVSGISVLTSQSNVVTGPLAQEIHHENIEKLKEMSKDEILAEKKNLEAMLDPKTVAFIKSMRTSKSKSKEELLNFISKQDRRTETKMEIDDTPVPQISNSKLEVKMEEVTSSKTGNPESMTHANKMDVVSDESEDKLPKPIVEIAKCAEAKGWVHMDDPEPEKVKWMEELNDHNSGEQSPNEPYNARFDFNGTLLPFNDENLTVDKGLHHHGEEPSRPGYSLQELLQLSRSAAQQQRCTAIMTLASILEKTHLGWYDRVLQPPLLKTLSQKNIFLLLRFSLDDTALPVITASLQALRAYIFCETDEVCLDRMDCAHWLLSDHPIMKTPKMKECGDVEDMKDHELAQIDTVAVAMRSDIVLRIRFILSELQPPPAGITAALEILTRLVRHSRETAQGIANTPNLLDIIVNKSIPLSMRRPELVRDSSRSYACPLVAAVRFCRILCIYCGESSNAGHTIPASPVLQKLKDLRIIHSLLTYISSDAGKDEVRLHIESLRLWKLLLENKIEIESISAARPTLITQLKSLATTLDLGLSSPLKCEYAAALIEITECDEVLKEHVVLLLTKWSTQLSRVPGVKSHHSMLIARAMRSLNSIAFLERAWLKKSCVFEHLCSSSNLLSNVEIAKDRDPESLPSLGVMGFEGKLMPIMSEDSHVELLRTAMSIFINRSCEQEINQIFENQNFKNYLTRLKNYEWTLERSWFTRLEYSLILSIIQAANQFKISPKIDDTVWKIAIKLISALPADRWQDVKDILCFSLAPERINLRYAETGLQNLSLDEKYQNVADVPEGVPTLAIRLYEKYETGYTGHWSEAALPKDWVYLPLIEAYDWLRSRKHKVWPSWHTLSILSMLKLEMVMPELTRHLSPTLRFSRMLLLYLCDAQFIHPPESELPRQIISKLVKENYSSLDLSGEVPGLNSFTDLFTALCENFAGESYGQECFAQVLLVFVAQRFDKHYRKLLWSEQAGCISYCFLKPEQMLIPFLEYLYPLEEDSSLIEAYITAMVRRTVVFERSPALYRVALHHAGMYLKREEKLAQVMRSRIEKLRDDARSRNIAEALLSYVPEPDLVSEK